MFYYMYKIENKLNGMIYIGVHRTSDLEDGYMGSGKLIQRAIKKHGLENFEKTILEFFDDVDSMYIRESEIVNLSFLQRDDVYNLAPGGSGASIDINRKPFTGNHSAETLLKISAASRGRVVSDDTRAKLRSAMADRGHAWFSSHFSRCNSSPKSDAHRAALSLAANRAPKEVVICPHCGKSGGKAIMHRWHFDACKSVVLVV